MSESTTRPALKAIHTRTGERVNIGDTVIGFRGETATLTYLSRPATPGKSGKVVVTWDDDGDEREYYDKVFFLTVVTDDTPDTPDAENITA